MAKKPLVDRKILSLNMVVKDEEKNLQDMLKSVQNLFDEVVIIDTGSKDSTPIIARDFGAKVIIQKWKEDFSFHRNQGIENSLGEWIFYLDTDERISSKAPLDIKDLIEKSEGFDAFLFPVKTIFEGKEIEALEMVRLFKNKAGYRFYGRVFEQIGPSIRKNGGKIKRVKNIEIKHQRFSIEPPVEKVKRNLKLLKKQIAEAPDDPFMMTQLSWIAYQALDKTLAKKNTQKLIRDEKTPDLFKFRCYLLLGKIALDERDIARSEEFLDLALSLEPKSRELLYLSGLLNRDKGENEKAIEFFDKALKSPKKLTYHIPDIKIAEADIHYNIAYSSLYLGELDKAVDSLNSLIKEKDHLPSYLLLSEIFIKKADFKKAIEYLEKAKKIDSDNSQIYTRMGNIYFQQGDFKNAEDSYNNAAEKGANSPEIFNNIASTFAAAGKNDKAEEFFKKSVEKNPKFHEAHKNLGYFYMKQKKFDQAIESFEKAYSLKSISREAGDRLGEIYYVKGDFENSYRIYKSLLNLFPGDPRLYNNMGVCALNLNKVKEAITLFTSALELYPDYKDARDNLESIMKENKG